jgi:ribosomal protein S7
MECEHKKEGGICCGDVCFSGHEEFQNVIQTCIDVNTISRVKHKCMRIDQVLERHGKKAVAVEIFQKSLCPRHKMSKNAKIAERIEEALEAAGLTISD